LVAFSRKLPFPQISENASRKSEWQLTERCSDMPSPSLAPRFWATRLKNDRADCVLD
jgi:hypothetical protein